MLQGQAVFVIQRGVTQLGSRSDPLVPDGQRTAVPWQWGTPGRGDAHSSLCSGRHWGLSFSSRTASGAHTQGSPVSHCHFKSCVRSSWKTVA